MISNMERVERAHVGAKNGRYEYIAAIALTLCGLFLGLAWGKMYPFGEFTLVRNDAIFQYVGFIGWFGEFLRGNANLAYSFAKSLGGGTISLFGFILSSPFNLLAVFFTPGDVPKLFTLLYALKLSLASVTCLLFLRTRFPGLGLLGPFLSASYALALTNFTAGSNIMWLEGVYMLPLVCLGVYRIIEEPGRRVFLFVSVALSVVFNWYSAYMVCLFSVLYFFMECYLFQEMRLKRFLFTGVSYGAVMILALLASMALFFPVIKYMLSSAAVEVPVTSEFNTGLEASPVNFLAYFYYSKYTWEPWANFPISGVVLLSSVLTYFTGSTKHKIALSVAMTFFYLSVCWPPLALVWTGFMRAESFMPRFAFVIMFTLVFFGGYAYRELRLISDAKKRARCPIMALIALGAVFFVVILEIILWLNEAEEAVRGVAFQCLAIVAFAALLVLIERLTGALPSPMAKFLLVFAGISIGILFSVEQAYELKKMTYDGNSNYQVMADEYHDYIDDLDGLLDSLENGTFFRVERVGFSSIQDLNISLPTGEYLATGMRGLSHYSSATQQPVNSLLGNLGYCLTPGTRAITYYNCPILPTDSILGVRYLLMQDTAPVGMNYIKKVEIGNIPDVSLYENPYALSLGFGVSDGIESVDWGENVFHNQAMWVSELVGDKVSLYNDARVERSVSVLPSDSEIARVEGNTKTFNVDTTEPQRWSISANADGPLYCFVDSTDLAALFVDGEFAQTIGDWEFDTNVIYLGDYSEGDVVDITVLGGNDLPYPSVDVSAATLDMTEFERAISSLAEYQLQVVEFSDGYVSGTFYANNNQKLLLTIPAENGWTVTVDGDPVEVEERNGLMLVPVHVGENQIELRYEAPGVFTGLLISCIGIIGFVLLQLACRLPLKKLPCS